MESSHSQNIFMSKSFFRVSTRLLVTTALILGSYFSLAKSVLAQSTPPNTTITNTAVGTFEGTTSGTTGNVTSNTVTLSVLEVAGINAAPSGNQEAPFAVPNAGAFQGVAGINTGDVVYFDFTVTNVGNDPTGFFIPGTATIGGGTLENIQIIEVDPNGALGAPTPTTVAVTVPVGGDNTIALLGATNGYIPVNGTVTVRVAVKVTETNVGNSITATLGNTTGSAGTQNQPYLANANQDLYTNDLIDGTTIPVPYAGILAISQVPETNGNPANGDATNRRQEASATGSVTLAATPVVFGYKSVTRTNDVDGSGTNTPGDVLTWRVTYANTGTVDVTDFQIADVLPANVTLSGTLAAGNITVNATQSGTTPIANAGYTGTGNNNLFNSSFTLVAGGVVTVDIPVTINGGTPSGTVLSNQPTATSTVLPAVGVRTDNIDGTNVGLPLLIPPPTGSILQTQTVAIDPTTATTSAAQTPLVCDGRFYQIRATVGDTSSLYLINRFTAPYSDVLRSTTAPNTVLNGLGYNPIDNYMYALFRGPNSGSTSGVTPTNALYRLDENTIVSLGGITGLPNGFSPTAADFGPDGTYYVTRAGGSTELYRINIATRTATLVTMSQNTGNIGDMAYNPIDGLLYGVGGAGNTTLFIINPVTGNVTTSTITGTSVTPETWGTAFFDPIGTFYAYSNGGRFYRINKDTGVATLLSDAPTATVSDGAVCQFTSEKIDAVKSAGPVTSVNATTFDIPYTIQVRNTGAFNAPNVQITENFNLDPTFTVGSPTISIQVPPTSGTLTVNPAFTGLTPTTYNLLSGLNSLAPGASATITFTVRLVYASAGSVPTTVLNNQVYASTITSTTAPGTPNPGFTFPSNIPIPPPDLLTADTSTNSNTLPVTPNGDVPSPTPVSLPRNPNLLLVKRMTAVNGVDIPGFVDDLGTLDDNNANWPTPATFLRGAINNVLVAPGDELEYTIYFLSSGNTNVSNVTICDLIPPLTTFVNNTYGSGLGMAFANSVTATPTSNLTNIADSDKGRFYPAGSTPNTTVPPVTVCNKPNTAIPLTIDDNTDGLVVVEVVKISDPLPNFLPFATGAGTPTNSYGFVRFRVKVK